MLALLGFLLIVLAFGANGTASYLCFSFGCAMMIADRIAEALEKRA